MSFSKFDLTGKVALITGGNSGIGLGMAQGLADSGANVCVWGTNEMKNIAAEKSLTRENNKVAALQCDVSDENAVENAFKETLQIFGKVDSCFANAGAGGGAALTPSNLTTDTDRMTNDERSHAHEQKNQNSNEYILHKLLKNKKINEAYNFVLFIRKKFLLMGEAKLGQIFTSKI